MQLKPCPFCGEIPHIEQKPIYDYDGYYKYDIHCEKCGCHINLGRNDTIYNTDEEARQNAINAWNKRVKKSKYHYNKGGIKMKLCCQSCGHEFEGLIFKDDLGFHTVCPICESSFDVDFYPNIPMSVSDNLKHIKGYIVDDNGKRFDIEVYANKTMSMEEVCKEVEKITECSYHIYE